MDASLAIIGAGPAGLYAAREASRLGLSVTVYEKYCVGEKIHCAEGFFDMLKLLNPPSHGVRFKVSETIFTAKDTFHIDCSKLNMWMIDRAQWQQGLAREVLSQGCVIHENTPVTPQLYKKLEEQYDWIIDASGVSAFSIKTGGVPQIKHAHTAQYTLEGDFSHLYGKIKAAAEPDYYGYYWIFPKARDMANVGLGWFAKKPGTNLSIHRELIRILQKEGLQDYKILKKSGGPIPVSMVEKAVHGKTLLVGDAAGLASPLHGGGVDTACISGVLAARALAQGRPDLYEASLKKVLGTRLALEQKILDFWQTMDFDDLNELLTIAFGKGLSRFGTVWKHRKKMMQEAAILRYFCQGGVRADWQDGVSMQDLNMYK
ncbi:MAG: NAD(P)/FAD-dependent oxidoreductase [Dethiobacter sp.]|jgi:digeranylgeranylglycerophospholipid reductase|nr:NAD(P)/FAD-dependent oxidoreductase [Dethiobacter sp.]